MVQIKVKSKNAGSKKLSAEQRRLVKDFISWSLVHLLGEKVASGIEITLILDGNLYNKDKSYGYALWEDSHYRGREFILEIDTTFSFINILHTVAHELIHVKQWAKGEYYMSLRNSEVYVYNKKKYNAVVLDYWEHPWEWEAHGRAISILSLWLRDRKHRGKTWAKQPITLG